MAVRWIFASLLALAAAGCLPLTFSHEGAIDFTRYRTVYVAPVGGDAAGYARAYLVSELRAHSGFARVLTEPVAADVTLVVTLALDEEVTYDEDGTETSYEGDATYVAHTHEGILEEGVVSGDGDTFSAAVEDTLDEIVLHYLRPYRL